MRKALLGTILVVALVIGLVFAQRSLRVKHSASGIVAGDDAQVLPANAKLHNLSTKETVSFTSYSGKVVLVNFWASWCEACMAEMPSIQKLYDAMKDKGFRVISINVDDNPEKVVPQIVQRLHLNFPIYTDTDGDLSRTFQVMAIPFSVVADRKQKILWSDSGERDWFSDSVLSDMKKILETGT